MNLVFFKSFCNYPGILNRSLKFLSHPHGTHPDPLILQRLASLDTSRPVISTCRSPIIARVARNFLGILFVHLLHHTSTGGFLLWTSERRKCDTSRRLTTPIVSKSPPGNREEQHIQPIRDKEQVLKQILIIPRERGRNWRVEVRRRLVSWK